MLKNLFFGIIAGIENAFNPKDKKRFIQNILLLFLCIFLLLGFGIKSYNNKKSINDSLDGYKISNFSSIRNKQFNKEKEYNKAAKKASIDGNSKKQFENERKALQIQNAKNAQQNYELVSPGQVAKGYLSLLTNNSLSWNKKVSAIQNCDFTPGQTIWLFKNWISNIIGIDPNNTKEGFVYQSRDLYLNYPNITQQQADYLNKCIQLIWKSSDLYVIVNNQPLKIHYLNQPQYNQNCNKNNDEENKIINQYQQ